MQQECSHCKGKGRVIKRKCGHCKGRMVQPGRETLTVDVERGAADGDSIPFIKHGDENPDHTPGNLYFRLQQRGHPKFRRAKKNLHTTMRLSLAEALLGFTKEVQHLDGRKVPVSRSMVTQHGDVQRIVGEGMPEHKFASNRGDLLVDYVIELPRTLTDKQREGLTKLFAEGGGQ